MEGTATTTGISDKVEALFSHFIDRLAPGTRPPQARLVDLMQIKQELLSIALDGVENMPVYFTEDDRCRLLEWSDECARTTLITITNNLTRLMHGCILPIHQSLEMILRRYILRNVLCPWCVVNEKNCTTCGYTIGHGICCNQTLNNSSTWSTIIVLLQIHPRYSHERVSRSMIFAALHRILTV
jgi:hypothetical protein